MVTLIDLLAEMQHSINTKINSVCTCVCVWFSPQTEPCWVAVTQGLASSPHFF